MLFIRGGGKVADSSRKVEEVPEERRRPAVRVRSLELGCSLQSP